MTGKLIDALRDNLAAFHDTKQSNEERAIALSWVLHLAGDLHQPLHVATLVNKDFPKGDRGGNSTFVRGSERARKPIPLHKIWDDAIGGKLDLQRAANRATELLVEFKPINIGGSLMDWVAASYEAAASRAYLGGKLGYALIDSDTAPVLPEGYTKDMQKHAQEQAVLAGYRLAGLLKRP